MAGLLVGVAGLADAKTPSGKTPGGSGIATATGPLTAADLASAVATARLRKARVEVLGLGTDRSRTWVNPNGTVTTQAYELPVRYRAGGRWVDVDTTLAAVAGDGSVRPRGHVRGLRLAGAGAGSNPTLVQETTGSRKVSVGWRGRLPRPVLDGDTATYREVTPGADVTVRATRTGFEENVVLKSRPAAGYSVTIPVTAKGLRARQSGDGSVLFTDPKGKLAGVIPAPVMWDASVDPRSLEHTRHAPVAMRVVQSGDTVNLTLTPDRKFLDDPGTRYPVTVDPSVSLSTVLDTFAQISYTTPQWSSTDLKLGSYNAGGDVARSFLQFPVQRLHNTKILSASVSLYEYWSSNCVQSSWELWQTDAATTSTVWTNQPKWMTKYATTTQTKGYPSSCGGAVAAGWVSIDASGFLQYAGDHGYSYANIGLRATTETDSNSWKRFYSANNGTNVPYLSVTYQSYPMTSAPTLAPGVSATSGGKTTLYTNTTTPQLQATVTDADGGNVMVQWNVYDTTGGANTKVISNLDGSWTGSGGISSARVPGGVLVNGHRYAAWPWGYSGSLWSRQTVAGGLVFTVDTDKPAGPTVASTDYPRGGWAKGAGQAGTITITPPSGAADTAGIVWQLDDGTQTTLATTGAAVTVTVTPDTDGPHTLTTFTRNIAGTLSDPVTYAFNAGSGAVTSPASGDRTARRLTLTAAGPSTASAVTFQYRRADADAWSDIPVADVTAAGNTLASWPVTMSDGASVELVWDAAATLGDDGSVQIRGEFTTGNGVYCSSAVTGTLDRKASGAAVATVGPGTVNLSTGDYQLSATDASAFGLAVTRSASSRDPGAGATIAGQSAPFGSAWTTGGVSGAAGTAYAEIRMVTSTAVQLVSVDGSELAYTANPDGTWASGPGAEDTQLSYDGTTDEYTLTDTAGTVTVFAKSAATVGMWSVASTTPAGVGNATRYRFDTVTTGSGTLVRLARMAAPTSAIGDLASSCLTPVTPVVGCRVLELGYATSTTATGTTADTFGDFTGRVATITLWAADPTTGKETSTVVARYAYDTAGALRQVWDPRIIPNLVTSYQYDPAGRVATLTPPGQLPWTFGYGTAGTGGDINAGRLLTVNRPTLTPGSASATNGTATTSLVYGVPLTKGTGGGPYPMGTSDVAAWAQTDVPTDATAVFPADQVPASHTGTGLSSGAYTRASIHYLDVTGNEVNQAGPGGHLTTTEYDQYGNTVRELTAGNRELALAAGSDTRLTILGMSAMDTAQRARLLSTQHVYDADGQRETDTYGPAHETTVEHAVAASGTSAALPAGTVVVARAHTHNTYDQGRPTDGSAETANLVTRSVAGATIAGYPADADTRTTTTEYDWTLGLATKSVTDPSGLAITHVTGYDTAGRATSVAQPKSTGGDAGTTRTTYYTAGGSGTCGGHPEWADLLCRTSPAATITGGGSNPSQLVTATTTYTRDGSTATVTETANGVTTTTTTSYDTAGRPTQLAVAGGSGQAVKAVATSYDPSTGQVASISTPDGRTITHSYDQLGRQVSYTDADSNTTSMQYDALDRPTQITDSAPSTTTISYATDKDPRGLPTAKTDSDTGTFTASYDSDGNLVAETLPGAVTLTETIDPAGQHTHRTYTDKAGNVLVSDHAGYSTHGQQLTRALSTTGGLGLGDTYTYDAAGRLTQATEAMTEGQAKTCTIRSYRLDANGNRTSQTTRTGTANLDGSAPTCPSSGGTTATHAYDTADRLVDTGYTYDAFGRTISEPTGVTTAYYVTDLAYQQVTAGTRTTWQLDPAGRFRAYTTDTNTSGTWTQTASRISHYANDSDTPTWTVEDATTGAYTRNTADLDGKLAATYTSSGTTTTLQLTSLHGDVTMTLPVTNGNQSVAVMASDEYGNTITGATPRYGWVGAWERSTETPTGDTLMGARLYNPTLGRFLSVDPELGGNENAYTYPNDPVNLYDLNGEMWSSAQRLWSYVSGWHHTGSLWFTESGWPCVWVCGIRWYSRTMTAQYLVTIHLSRRDVNWLSFHGGVSSAVTGGISSAARRGGARLLALAARSLGSALGWLSFYLSLPAYYGYGVAFVILATVWGHQTKTRTYGLRGRTRYGSWYLNKSRGRLVAHYWER